MVINPNPIEKIINFSQLNFESIEIYSINKFYNSNLPQINKTRGYDILQQLLLEHSNEKEEVYIIQLWKEFQDIFELDGDSLTFINKMKNKIN